MGKRMQRLRRGVVALTGSLALVALGALSTQSAAAGPAFPVMNTSESPPDGVYFRTTPQTANTLREPGFGVYMNETVEEVCYAWGDSVGAYGNTLWYYVNDLSRPTVNGHANSGYLNAHYINDGTVANQVVAGVSQCGAASPPPPPPPPPASACSLLPPPPATAVYFSPFEGTKYVPAGRPAVSDVCASQWINSAAHCDTTLANRFLPPAAHTLAGWSIGRLGPIYALGRASWTQRQQVTYVYMIDPGNTDNLSGCDSQLVQVGDPLKFKRPGQILAEWLRDNTNARLTIMAGSLTAQNAHAGIQNAYFNDIRAIGNGVRSRVYVCNYDNTEHYKMFNEFNAYINRAPITSSCPTSAGGVRPTRATPWHP